MDHFTTFRLFIRLVETKSLSRAAADLEMPRSIASKLLADLEMRLGEKLVKDSRQFRLTAEGNRYYGEVRPLMAQLGVVGDEPNVSVQARGLDSAVLQPPLTSSTTVPSS